jgi:hypothetical protein
MFNVRRRLPQRQLQAPQPQLIQTLANLQAQQLHYLIANLRMKVVPQHRATQMVKPCPRLGLQTLLLPFQNPLHLTVQRKAWESLQGVSQEQRQFYY